MARAKRPPCPETSALNARLGKTVERLRRAQDLSISALSEQSGVAKSMISQIEKNEANPSVATLFRLSQALGTSVQDIVSADEREANDGAPFVEKAEVSDIPLVLSEDGLCELRILSSLDTVTWAQTYDFRAKTGGVLDSSPHPDGTIENLSVLSGELEVEVGGVVQIAKAGETLRYRGDREHVVRNVSDKPAHATMICLCPRRLPLAAQA
jgi:transcriptional regulator with XRE-family HTH domain